LAVAIGFSAAVRQRKTHRYVLPDGTSVEFLGTSSGTNHVRPGRAWAKPLTWLPEGWLSRLGLKYLAASSLPVRTARPTVLAYFHWKSHGAMPVLPGSASALALTTLDGANFATSCGWTPTGLPILAFELDTFPRRDPFLRLRPLALEPGTTRTGEGTWRTIRLDTIEIPNPTPIVAPHWKPSAWPAAWRTDRIEAILDSLAVQPVGEGTLHPVGLFQMSLAHAHLRILEDGAPTEAWEPCSLEVHDATGNRIALRLDPAASRLGVQAPGRFDPAFEWRLCSTETAWKLHVGLQRTRASKWRPQEQLWVRGIRLPKSDENNELNQRVSVNGLDIEILALVGDHAGLPERPHDVMGQVILEVRCPKPLPDRALRVSLFTRNGREIEPVWTRELMSYGFELPPGEEEIDLRLGVFQRHVAEFIIRPDFVLEGDAKKEGS
jgi:hypothetical protein